MPGMLRHTLMFMNKYVHEILGAWDSLGEDSLVRSCKHIGLISKVVASRVHALATFFNGKF